MCEPVIPPAQSDTLETGRLVQRLKQSGDPVKNGDVPAGVETDKAIMDVEAFHDGYLVCPLAPPDAGIPVGSVIAHVGDSPQPAPEGQVSVGEKKPVKETNIAPKGQEKEKQEKNAARFLQTLSGNLSSPESISAEPTDNAQPSLQGETS